MPERNRSHHHEQLSTTSEPIETALSPEREQKNIRWNSLENGTCAAHAEFHHQLPFGRIDGRTDTGGPRAKYDHNEDSLCVVNGKNYSLVSIIDGAGGSDNGRLASLLGTELLTAEAEEYAQETEEQHGIVPYLLRSIDEKIWNDAKGGYATGVLIELYRTADGTLEAQVGAAGDAKILTVRSGQAFSEGTTTFQNYAQKSVERGEIGLEGYYNHHQLNVITGGFGLRAGNPRDPFEIKKFSPRSGDSIILADDGLWDIVSEFEAVELSQQFSGQALEQKLFELAFSRNNAVTAFSIRHNAHTTVQKQLSYIKADAIGPEFAHDDVVARGDNITLAVITIG